MFGRVRCAGRTVEYFFLPWQFLCINNSLHKYIYVDHFIILPFIKYYFSKVNWKIRKIYRRYLLPNALTGQMCTCETIFYILHSDTNTTVGSLCVNLSWGQIQFLLEPMANANYTTKRINICLKWRKNLFFVGIPKLHAHGTTIYLMY